MYLNAENELIIIAPRTNLFRVSILYKFFQRKPNLLWDRQQHLSIFLSVKITYI